MNIQCIDIKSDSVFALDLDLGKDFSVQSGLCKEFTEDLYRDLSNFVNENITEGEFTSSIYNEMNISPEYVLIDKLDEDSFHEDYASRIIYIESYANEIMMLTLSDFKKYLKD